VLAGRSTLDGRVVVELLLLAETSFRPVVLVDRDGREARVLAGDVEVAVDAGGRGRTPAPTAAPTSRCRRP